MKEFGKVEAKIGYDDPRMVVSVSVDKGDYEAFERACRNYREEPAEILRKVMEAYAYAGEKDELDKRCLENFISKGFDEKLGILYMKLCKMENKLNNPSTDETGCMNLSVEFDKDESLPFD